MKSWLHNIAESYIYETPGTRRDLKEHYNLLTEEEKFALLSENALKYLDEQLKTAYGFGISDLTEEELGTILSSVFLLEFDPNTGAAWRAKPRVAMPPRNLGDPGHVWGDDVPQDVKQNARWGKWDRRLATLSREGKRAYKQFTRGARGDQPSWGDHEEDGTVARPHQIGAAASQAPDVIADRELRKRTRGVARATGGVGGGLMADESSMRVVS